MKLETLIRAYIQKDWDNPNSSEMREFAQMIHYMAGMAHTAADEMEIREDEEDRLINEPST